MSKNIPNKTIKSRAKPQTGIFAVTSEVREAFSAKQNLILYRLVYSTKGSLLVVALLCFSFLLQGAHSAVASADVIDAMTKQAEITASPSDSSGGDSVTEPDSIADFVFGDQPTTNQISDEQPAIDQVSNEDDLVVESELALVNQETDEGSGRILSTDSDSTGEDTLVVTGDNELASSTLVVNDIGAESVPSDVSDTSELVESEIHDESELTSDVFVDFATATSAEEQLANTVVVSESDSEFSFTTDECTKLATGSFYCLKSKDTTRKDDLFSKRDAEGDLEIYLVRDGVETQVTSNEEDDAAPYFDINSNTIVWHRLINDRYQIVAYDVDTGKEEYLTNTAENNMEPNRQGKYTVWQRWTHGGWNIVLSDGRNEKLITNSTSHNVAPYIHGSLVVWNRYDQVSERTIEMYDIDSETYVSVEDPDGMSVSNPRMVFVYDSIHPNGDIVTKGYDLLAKKFIDLDTLPRDLPDSIPNSDSTGETRALIQNKASGKSEIEEMTATSTSNNLGVATTSSDLATTSVSLASTTESAPLSNLAPSATTSPDLLPTLDLTAVSPQQTVESVPTTTMSDIPDLIIDNQSEAVVIPLEIEHFVEPGV